MSLSVASLPPSIRCMGDEALLAAQRLKTWKAKGTYTAMKVVSVALANIAL